MPHPTQETGHVEEAKALLLAQFKNAVALNGLLSSGAYRITVTDTDPGGKNFTATIDGTEYESKEAPPGATPAQVAEALAIALGWS